MAQIEESKFSGALAALRKPSHEATADTPQIVRALEISNQREPQAESRIDKRRKGRPVGKRSDPAFKPTTLILREQTTKIARRKLEDTNARLDLSELVENLLTEWTKQ